MPSKPKLSVYDKLLIAAFGLSLDGRSPFSAEDLVVAAWKMFPNTFGLSGHHDADGRPLYPDSNRVFAEIMGSKPIRKRGFLVKVAQKMYDITQMGRDVASQLEASRGISGRKEDRAARVRLSRDVLAELRRLLGSRAVQKVDNAQIDALTFHDACLFWGITPQSSAIELDGKLANAKDTIAAAKRVLSSGETRFQHGGQPVSEETLDLIFLIFPRFY